MTRIDWNKAEGAALSAKSSLVWHKRIENENRLTIDCIQDAAEDIFKLHQIANYERDKCPMLYKEYDNWDIIDNFKKAVDSFEKAEDQHRYSDARFYFDKVLYWSDYYLAKNEKLINFEKYEKVEEKEISMEEAKAKLMERFGKDYQKEAQEPIKEDGNKYQQEKEEDFEEERETFSR